MGILDVVLSDPELTERPPVLVDVGASGELPEAWMRIAPHAVCVACDADDRAMDRVLKQRARFKTFHLVDRIVVDTPGASAPFFLTRSPFCSSTLKPDAVSLEAWYYAPLFEVAEQRELPTTTLTEQLDALSLDRVDWFKCDSQGTDLRLMKSLGERMGGVLLAELEPGILSSYEGEDYLSEILAFMRNAGFWVSDMRVMGARRISRRTARRYLPWLPERLIARAVRESPGWAELTFLSTLPAARAWSRRDRLLAWVFATLERQHGFALEILDAMPERETDPLIARLVAHSTGAIRRGVLPRPPDGVRRLPRRVARKLGLG